MDTANGGFLMGVVLITGFTGQVGSQLAEYIAENTDHEIVGFMRWQEDQKNISAMIEKINKSDGVYVEYGDLQDYASIQACIKKWYPTYIFHLGAQSYPKTSFSIPIETLQTNIIGTANLLEVVKGIKSPKYDPVIHICSSSEVYGKATSTDLLNEDTPFHGASPYSISKIGTDYLGQFYAEAYGLKTFITRMGTHSGKRRSDVFFESTVAKQIALIEAGLQNPEIKIGNLNSIRTFQDTRDAIKAYWLLAEAMFEQKITAGDVFNIAGDEKFKLSDVVDIMLSMSSVKNIRVVCDPERLRPIDADYQMFDNSKIKSVIPWEPQISVSSMFEDLINHWRSEVSQNRIPLDR